MIRTHVTAVLGLLSAVPNLTVYDAIVPDKPALPYVVLRVNSGPRSRTSIVANSDRLDLSLWCTSVGSTREQAQWAAERVTTALLDVRPIVSGRQSFPITAVNSQPTQRDDTVNPPLVYALNEFALSTIP